MNFAHPDAEEILSLSTGPVAAYSKTHAFSNVYLSREHQSLAEAPVQAGSVKIKHIFKGSLRAADAAKIYELAYYSTADTIDLGTYHGLSAAIAAKAIGDARKPFVVHTVDLSERLIQRAVDSFNRHGVTNVRVHSADAAEWLRTQAAGGRRFGFAFVDHSSLYASVAAVCEELPSVLLPDAFVAFHDIIDRRNALDDPGFAVARAVTATLDGRFIWKGAAGCIGFFQFRP